jgi:CRISPR-associated DxTHG motif protein
MCASHGEGWFMKVLSFLGTSNYSPALYTWDTRVCTTSFFPVAACAFFGPDELLLATTDGARGKWWAEVSTELKQRYPDVTLTEVPIPDGSNEAEIWRIFDALVERFSPGDEVIIDITHGFRSLPVLAVIAAAYLRVARDVTVQRLVYGAFDAKKADATTPVFDLTPFLTLLEWTGAADLFKRTGNAEPLAGLLVATQNALYRSRAHALDLPTKLKSTGQALASLSEALRLVRVHEAMRAAHDVADRLEAARPETTAWARPFVALLDQMRDAYQPFALASPEKDPLRDLKVQLEMIRWYAEKGWGAEAVALAREWMVSLEALRSNLDLLDRHEREVVENALNTALETKKGPVRDSEAARAAGSTPKACDPLPASVDLWSELHDLRNDIAHAGMRRDPRPAKSIGVKVVGLHGRLAPLLDEIRASEAGGR